MAVSAKSSEAIVLAEVPSFRDAIVKRSLKDVIADRIAGLIASGIVQVGDALPSERELASSLNVSRETMRGAIQILAARGILEISHGARTRVVRVDVGPVTIGVGPARAINAYDIDSVHAARLLVEREVVAGAARRIDDATLATLDGLLAVQKEAFDDPVGFLICDREFHVTIYRASGNALLADFAADLYSYMMEYRRIAVARPEAIATSYADHAAIVAALRAHDPDAAVAAFADHTDRIYQTTQTVMGIEKK
ncbi:GntR family transcriptional regulator [Hyphomicrobiales bacterium]|nr:GntR family transcriptional regulator [Hyphomicrobiales bacterium]CAH1674800.1 GntR family transcriptional regulator [Hyphomicrobiales bacterium]